jgi:serine protease AprX
MRTGSLRIASLLGAAALAAAPLGLAPPASAASASASALLDTGWQAGGWQGTDGTGTGLSMTNVAKAIGAYGDGLDGTGVGIALVDTGVSQVPGLPATHIVNGPDLSFESQGASVRYRDTYGHGTHMAGILVGNDTATGFKGLAPGAKLFSVKVSTAAGSVDVSQVIAGIDWVVQHRNDDPAYPVRVLNLSYGTPGTQPAWSDPLTFAVENAWKHGIVVVVAGGNGTSTSTLTNPGYDPAVITVGSAATNATPSLPGTTLSSFTDTSTARDVDITAPGQSIVSLRDPYSNVDATYPAAEVGTSQFRGSGTSQAAAVVSGAVALLLQKRPTLTPDQVKAVLKATATPLTSGSGATQKLGFVNLAKALTASVPAVQTIPAAYGTGSLENARGGIHVVHDGVPLEGEFVAQGAFNPAVWAQTTAALGAWQGGTWMGFPLTGSGWTGTSWASKTWATTTWTSTAWYGGTSWTDSTWAKNSWSNGSWSGHYWSGHYWSSDGWSDAYWG